MSNNSTSPLCWQSDRFFILGDNLNYAQYNAILPSYATIGLFGHTLLVAVFVKQAKNEKAYVYQIFLEITECLGNVVFTMFLLTFLGSGYFGGVNVWYQRNYFLMWYTAHLALPLVHGLSNTGLLLAVSMAADRAFALLKPFVYKDINHKMHQLLALILCLVLGFSTTIFNARLFEVQNDAKGYYVIGADMDFVGSLTDTILSHVCNITRLVGLLALIMCNICILYTFRKHMIHKSKLMNAQSSTSELKRESRERATERSLLLLTVTQSFFTAVSMLSYVLFYTAVFAIPLFMVCDQAVYSPLLDCVLMVCDLGKTCLIVGLNRKSREMLLRLLCISKYCRCGKVETVISTSNAATGIVVLNRLTTPVTLFNDQNL